jgi:hypothetical protein
MAKITKSQWAFGEVFPAEATRGGLMVSELRLQILQQFLDSQAGLLQDGLQSLWLD